MTAISGHIPVRRKSIGKPGDPGLPGLIHRTSEWASGIEYRNDSAMTSDIRYLDIAVATTGANTFRAFRCKKTHTSSSSITYTNTTYWEEMNSMYPIYTPLIMAQNAVLKFTQTNKLYVMKDDGVTVNLGMGGGDYPLWIGAPSPGSASFKVSFAGKLSASGVDISGKITATEGKFGIFSIGSGGYNQGGIYASYSSREWNDKYSLRIEPNRISIEGSDLNGDYFESIVIAPYYNPDWYDLGGIVNLWAGHGKNAIYIERGMIEGIRPSIIEVSASTTLRYDTTVVRGATGVVRLNASVYIEKGTHYHVINAGSYGITIYGAGQSDDYSIHDLINGERGTRECTISSSVKSFYITYDGTYINVYQ